MTNPLMRKNDMLGLTLLAVFGCGLLVIGFMAGSTDQRTVIHYQIHYRRWKYEDLHPSEN